MGNLMMMQTMDHHDALQDTIYMAASHQLNRAERYMADRFDRESDQEAWSSARFRRLRNLANMWTSTSGHKDIQVVKPGLSVNAADISEGPVPSNAPSVRHH